ncbi:MAG TPA: hypothetical protein VFT26_12195 [Pyrinomonadaceae bacterium]|nr:hypothetical protein [Pyrinomonadaceae bacterium]
MLTLTEYQSAMARIEILMQLDPIEGSEEGNELTQLVDRVIEYELHHYPIPPQEQEAPCE